MVRRSTSVVTVTSDEGAAAPVALLIDGDEGEQEKIAGLVHRLTDPNDATQHAATGERERSTRDCGGGIRRHQWCGSDAAGAAAGGGASRIAARRCHSASASASSSAPGRPAATSRAITTT